MNPGTNPRTRTDVLLLAAFCGFLFFYGLGAIGLLGADEPRYAQVSREMLDRSDWITPTLQGKAWLEKPVLYYWQARLSFRVAGNVTDKAARMPAGFDAAMLIAVIYLFLRRFRPGGELDGALITASCAAVIGFAHAAATDMPLASCFAIGLLAWYAWYESGRRGCLAAFYIFLALGTLAKGPVAPALSAVILFLFVAVKRDWRAIPRTLWIPGIVLYLAVMLPWYLAVQLRNPEFFRVFILEHNLARFSQDVYHHRQPFWFYLPVFLLAMMPWTIVLVVAVAERARLIWSERKEAFSSSEDSWPLFLLVWMLVPILFFSASQSKLPGYILPAVPAAALLVAEYLAARRSEERKFSLLFAASHGILCGLLVFAALSAGSIAMNRHLVWGHTTYVAAAIAAILALGTSAALLSRNGLRLLRPLTMVAVVVSVAAIIRFAAPVIDATQSTRPIAESIQAFSHEPVPVALYHLNRVQEYGLEFYLNRPAQKYEEGNVPAAAHVLVAAQNTQSQVAQLVPGRRVSYLTSIPAQKLDLYWVGR
ncbi:MAG: glycosyltransferase family 39 protein [Acidobacteriia bacterium]|nr:glycosyltransferase family 39 protein [Terriglobia bacterium]